jgi:hypothetical protein
MDLCRWLVYDATYESEYRTAVNARHAAAVADPEVDRIGLSIWSSSKRSADLAQEHFYRVPHCTRKPRAGRPFAVLETDTNFRPLHERRTTNRRDCHFGIEGSIPLPRWMA